MPRRVLALLAVAVCGAGCGADNAEPELRSRTWDVAIVRDGRAYVGVVSNLTYSPRRARMRISGDTAFVDLLSAPPQSAATADRRHYCVPFVVGPAVEHVLDGAYPEEQARRRAARPDKRLLRELRGLIRDGWCRPLPTDETR